MHTGALGAGSEASDRERYLDLYRRKQKAERLNALWKLEGDLAAKRTAYAVLDLTQRKLYVKVRGRTFKAVSFTALSATRRSRPVAPDELAWRAFTLQIKEGKGVETESIQRKSLSEQEAKQAGRSDDESDEPIGAEQGGAVETSALSPEEAAAAAAKSQKIVGVAGGAIPPDPPPKYHMGFDGDLSLWVVSDVPQTPKATRYDAMLGLARSLGRLFGGSTQDARVTRIEAHLPLPLAQQMYRELLPGQRLLITQ
jgi:hypothetical protein